MKCNPWVGGSMGRRGFPMLGTGKRGLSTLIKEVFRNGEQGVFYDPFDISTMYRDAVGTSPVSETAQPLGLFLDKSKWLVLGVERAPSITSMAGWSVVGSPTNGEVTSDGDSITFNANATGILALLRSGLSADKWYKATITIASVSGLFFVETSPGGAGFAITAPGTYSYFMRGRTNIYFRNNPNTTATAKITAVSVKELAGNHAYQTVSASRPLFRQVPIKEVTGYRTDRNYIEYDGVDDKLLTTFAAPLTNCTVVRAVPNEGTKILYNQTLPASYESTLNHSGFFAINRALSNSEKVLLLNEMDKRTGITSLDSQVARSFANNEVGVAFNDFNDMSVLFQDASGTIPVTAAGQPVGLILDKSKGMVLGDELNTGSWSVGVGWSVNSSVATHVSGVAGALNIQGAVESKFYKITAKITVRAGVLQLFTNGNLLFSVSDVGTKTHTFYGWSSTSVNGRLIDFYAKSSFDGDVDLSSISIKEISGNHAYQTVSASRPVLRQTPILGNELIVNGNFSNGTAGVAAKNNVTLSVTDGVLKVTNNDVFYGFAEMSFNTEIGKKYLLKADVIASSGAGASFHVASISNSSDILNNVDATTMAKGVVITATTTSTYISLKVPTNVVGSWRTFDNVSAKELQGYYIDRNYLEFDGVDDFLQTNNIDFTSTDKVSVFAGVRKLSDAATSVVAELSATVDGNTGAFRLTAPTGGGHAYQYISRGSTAQLAAANATNLVAPHSAVISAKSDINADISSLRINGLLKGTSASDQGTGNYGNHPLYIGRRAGTNLPFNGHLYSLIIMGRLASDTETTVLENAIAKQVGVTLNV